MGYAMSMLFDGPRGGGGSNVEEDEMVMGLASQVLFDDDDVLGENDDPRRRAALDRRVNEFLKSLDVEDDDNISDRSAAYEGADCNGFCFQLGE